MKVAFFMFFTFIFSFSVVATTIEDHYEYLSINESWSSYWGADRGVEKLIDILKSSKTGRTAIRMFLRRMQKHNKLISEVLVPSDGSLTDSTLLRRFRADNPLEMTFENQSKVYLNKHLTIRDAVLDLAHELTHYILRPDFNPYSNSFELKTFMEQTISGRGGEADAYIVECKVFKEVWGNSVAWKNSKCQNIIIDGKISKKQTVAYFYHIGAWEESFQNRLHQYGLSENDFPLISKRKELFVSSAYDRPYPIAIIEEYEQIKTRVCKNEEKRIGYIRDMMKRSPASVFSAREEIDAIQKKCL